MLCGDVRTQRPPRSGALRLALTGENQNIHLKLEDLNRRLVAEPPDTLRDLLEIASYVYAADSAITRGGATSRAMGAEWRRRFRCVVAVQRPDIWRSPEVSRALTACLSFLTEDEYSFEFEPLSKPPPGEPYLSFSDDPATGRAPQDVLLFSGGLDSLAGAVETLADGDGAVALVSHRSSEKIGAAQASLIRDLRERFGAERILPVPVRLKLDEALARERTHRSRSFLFSVLATVVAQRLGLDAVSFFENGVTSLNLPTTGQVVGARATRTTHPQALAGMEQLFSALFERKFEVANPYWWRTKTEVVERIAASGFGDLIRDTRSCANTHHMTRLNPHCGLCSQCIDRRFAVLAAGLGHEDPPEAYGVDLFTGTRGTVQEREMATSYVRAANALGRMPEQEFFSRYGEISRAIRHYREPPEEAARGIYDLHRRHSAAVCGAFDEGVRAHASAFREGALDPSCLLMLMPRERESDAHAQPTPPTDEGDPAAGGVDRSTPALASERRQEVLIALDEHADRVLLDRWGTLKPASSALVRALLPPFRQALADGKVPENFPCVQPSALSDALKVSGDEVVRRRVNRCRDEIAKLAAAAGVSAPPELVVENLPWHGYRLNPTTVRVVAASELRGTAVDKIRPLGAAPPDPQT